MKDVKLDAKNGSMKVAHAVIMYPWTDSHEQEFLNVDLLLMSGTTEKQIRVKVRSGGMYLEVEWDMPEAFIDKRRLVDGFKKKVKMNSHKAVAFAQTVRDLKIEHGCDEYNPTVTLKQSIKLPFKVDLDLYTGIRQNGCELHLIEHDDDAYRALGQAYLVYTVDLISAVKPLKKLPTYAAIRVLRSPMKEPSSSEEEFDDTMELQNVNTSKEAAQALKKT